ncbi:unnamed protein product [Camellia sinensis]
MENPLHLKSLNHISVVCRSIDKSLDFYQNVLGFFPIRRPNSFDFDGAWKTGQQGLSPHGTNSNHILNNKSSNSFGGIFQHDHMCESMGAVEKKLKEMEIEYLKNRVEKGGIYVDQLFFHDPDGSMIEICNCDNLPSCGATGQRHCPIVL